MPSNILIPSYFYPDPLTNDYWGKILNLAQTGNSVIAILNPNSGPTTEVDVNYFSSTKTVADAGVKVIAYIASSYGERSISDIESDINTYISQYPHIMGFFIDEMSNQQAKVSYYQEIHDYIKNINPSFTVVGNPGGATLETYIPTADILVTFEGSAALYQNYMPETWMVNYDTSHFSHLIYGVETITDAQAAATHAVISGSGNTYITNDPYIPGDSIATNPWDTLSSYYLNTTINGDNSSNTLLGTLSNDSIDGLAGHDTLVGSAGNDTYYVNIVPKNSRITASIVLEDTIIEKVNEGNDWISLRGDLSNLIRTTTLSLDNIDKNIENLDASNTGATKLNINGNASSNQIIGNFAANTIDGNEGNDFISGRAGNDVIIGGAGVDVLSGDEGKDTLIGGSGNDFLDGGADSDILIGGKGDDTYYVFLSQMGTGSSAGLTLEDTIIEKANEGIDWLFIKGDFSDLSTSSTIRLAKNIDNVEFIYGSTTKIDLIGNSLDNTMYGNNTSNSIDGRNGNDLIYGYAGADTLTGGSGDDNLNGDDGNDILNGGRGNDTLYGGKDIDSLIGGSGDDIYFVDLVESTNGLITTLSIQDKIIETNKAGNDTLYLLGNFSDLSSSTAFTLSLNIENLRADYTAYTKLDLTGNKSDNLLVGNYADNKIEGMDGNDSLYGNLGNDIVNGGAGDDILNGDAGDDILIGDIGNDTLFGGDGSDTLQGGDGNDIYFINDFDVIIETNPSDQGGNDLVISSISYTLSDNIENLTLSNITDADSGYSDINAAGNKLDNYIRGNAGQNILFGGEGNDWLIGGEGNDTLIGGEGNDTLIGGEGNDMFIFDSSLNRANNTDVALDFNDSEDLILLNGLIFNKIGTHLDEIEFISDTSMTSASDAYQRIIYNSSSGGLYYDADGVGGLPSVQFATIKGNVGTLSYSNFYIGFDFNIVGTYQDDVINGTSADDAIIGLAGDDSINGGLGADIMYGDLGSDNYYVDNINDMVIEDYFYFNESNGLFYENGNYSLGYYNQHPNNINTVYSEVTFTADFGIGNLTLIGTENINGYGSNQKSNVITGNDGNNILDGGIVTNPELTSDQYTSIASPYVFFSGYDTLIGGKGDDTYIIHGGETFIENPDEGIDTLVLSYKNDIVQSFLLAPNSEIENITLANDGVLLDYISGTNKGNLIIANNLANNIYGLDGNDELKGLGGNDKLYGMKGNDTLWGGEGSDIFVLESFGSDDADIIKDFVSGQDKISLNGGSFMPTLISGIYTDMFLSDIGAATSAQDDNDYIIYNKETGDLFFDSDGNGSNTQQLIANFLPNTLLLQSDFVDALTVAQNITLAGSELNDSLTGGNGKDHLSGLGGNDVLTGGAGDDFIDGGEGNDTLNGGLGNDYIDGGLGNDTVTFADNPNGIIFTLSDSSSQFTGSGIDTLVSIENVIGTNFWDNINGSDDDNILFGLGLDDALSGGGGNDIIVGGEGKDTLAGGAGSDIFSLRNSNESLLGGNCDVVTDFTQSDSDKVDLFTIDANINVAGDQAFYFIGNNVTFSSNGTSAGQLRFDSTLHSIFGDINGDTVADFQIILTGVTSLNASDFIL